MDTLSIMIVSALVAGILAMIALPIYVVNNRQLGIVRLRSQPSAPRVGLSMLDYAQSVWFLIRARHSDRQSLWRSEIGAVGKIAKTPPEVVHSGSVITLPALPTPMGLDAAIEWLETIKADQETVVDIAETIDAYPWDGARALMLAIKQKFGFAQATGFAPQMIEVKTDVDSSELVPWGQFELPNVKGRIYTGSTRNDQDQLVFQLNARVVKKQANIIRELAQLTREILQTDSIYRGKAVKFTVNDDDDTPNVPRFIDLSRVNRDELVFTTEVREQIETTMFAPLQKRAWCKALGIPFKRGICLLGAYGVGKTLAVYVAAQMAKQNGVTFVLVEDPETLPQAMLFARQYAPAVIAAEDIDRVTKERDDTCNDIMDSLDGVEAKDTDVMVIFTSNNGDDIHPAMRRPGRIDTFIRVTAPDALAVDALLRLYGRGLIDIDENLMNVGRMLSGQIPAVIREVVERAKLAAVARADTLESAQHLTAGDLVVASRRLLMQLDLFARKDTTSAADRLVAAVGTLGANLMIPAVAPAPAKTMQVRR